MMAKFLHQRLKYEYKHIDVNNEKEAIKELARLLLKAHGESPRFFCYDTETDGLNIITSKPFMVSMGFGKTVITMDYNENVMSTFWKMYQLPCADTEKTLQDNNNYIGLFAHNGKFDYHMMNNGGSRIPDGINIYDSITVARLTEYADDKESMSLENLGGKYVDENSKFAGHIIKDIIKTINAERREKLKESIVKEFPDDGFSVETKTGKKKYTGKLTKLLDDYNKYRTVFVNDDNVYFKFIDEHYSPATYKDVYEREPELMRNYAADDIVIMIEYLNRAIPTLENVDKDFRVLRREGELIRAVANMERTGLKVNPSYVLECRKKMCDYRDLLYFELNMYTGLDFTVGQHKFIKDMLLNKYNIKTDKTDEKALKYIKEHTKNDEVKDVCSNILELRTLDKWISTYVDGKLNSIIDGRIYTDINNNGAVSGRVSCDMQQQPKEGLLDRDGNELFHPRRMFVCDDDYILAFCDKLMSQ